MSTADIAGPQRKVIAHDIRPLKPSQGESGIPLSRGRTLPFVVERQWSAPAGHYNERFFIVDPRTREVLYESPGTIIRLMGLQAPTALRSVVEEPVPLMPGKYLVFWATDDLEGGTSEVEAAEVESATAAP
jgi:hypothetical protein